MTRSIPAQITRARERAGHSVTSLADLCGIAPHVIRRMEAAPSQSSVAELASIALACGIDWRALTLEPVVTRPTDAECLFIGDADAPTRGEIIARAMDVCEVLHAIKGRGVDLNSRDRRTAMWTMLPLDLTPKKAAEVLRSRWELGASQPLPNLLHICEYYGVVVLPMHAAHRRTGCAAMWVGDVPVMVLDMERQPSTVHRLAAEALGHLILHANSPTNEATATVERRAFATAFLGRSNNPTALKRPIVMQLIFSRTSAWLTVDDVADELRLNPARLTDAIYGAV